MKLPKDIRTRDDTYSAGLVCSVRQEGLKSGTLHPSVTEALRTLGWRAAR